MKKLVTAFVLTMFAATPAFAAKKHQTMLPQQAATAQASVPNDQNYLQVDQFTAVAYGKIVGRDPDPNIRLMLMRDTITASQ